MGKPLEEFYNYIELMLRRKWIIIVPVVVFTALGAVIAIIVPSYYRSTTIILVEKQQIPETYVTPTDRTPFSQKLNTLRQQIMSRQNLEKIIEEFHLYQNANSTNLVFAFLNRLGIKAGSSEPSKEALIELMSADVESKVIGDRGSGDAFSISFSGTDPFVTMQVTNKLASLFIEENLKAREQYAEGTSDFLSNELANAKKELESQERAVRSFKEKYMGSLPEQLDANLRTLDRLQVQLQAATAELKNTEDRNMLLESQLAQAGSVPSAAIGPNTPAVNPLVLELRRLQGELSGLLSVYKDNYPDVILAKKRINEIKEQLAKTKPAEDKEQPKELQEPTLEERNPEIYNSLLVTKSQIKTLQERIANIRQQIKIFEKRVEEAPANEQKFADLRRDYDISLGNYQALLAKKLSAKLAENLEKRQKGERFTVLDSANLPEKPFKPKRPVIVLMGTAAGAGVGLGIVLLLEFLNPAFRKPEDFEGVLQIKVLSTIPEFSMTPSADSKKG